jgi:hypothetical protein
MSMSEPQLRRLLAQLEIPACNCAPVWVLDRYPDDLVDPVSGRRCPWAGEVRGKELLPCRHALLKQYHTVALDYWISLCVAYSTLVLDRLRNQRGPPGKKLRLPAKDDYLDHSPPFAPQSPISRADRIRELASRKKAGVQLFHPAEWLSMPGVVAEEGAP